jgi:hypothetical protein
MQQLLSPSNKLSVLAAMLDFLANITTPNLRTTALHRNRRERLTKIEKDRNKDEQKDR